MAADLGTLPEQLAAPIPGGAPSGSDVRYDSDYEALKTEADKIGALTGGDVDWERIIQLSTGILTQKSKDLLVGTYLCFALFKSQGYPGLAAGLDGLRRLIEAHWEGLFPVALPHARQDLCRPMAGGPRCRGRPFAVAPTRPKWKHWKRWGH